jgi:hypothetical protein
MTHTELFLRDHGKASINELSWDELVELLQEVSPRYNSARKDARDKIDPRSKEFWQREFLELEPQYYAILERMRKLSQSAKASAESV